MSFVVNYTRNVMWYGRTNLVTGLKLGVNIFSDELRRTILSDIDKILKGFLYAFQFDRVSTNSGISYHLDSMSK